MNDVVAAPRQMITEKQVLGLIPVARSTLQAWVQAGTFPKPVAIGPHRRAWFAADVAAWQREREQQAA